MILDDEQESVVLAWQTLSDEERYDVCSGVRHSLTSAQYALKKHSSARDPRPKSELKDRIERIKLVLAVLDALGRSADDRRK